MQSRIHSSFNDESDLDLRDIDFSNASVESICEFLCDIFGIQALSPDILRAILPPESDCANIDWNELVGYLTTAQYATDMSLEQAIEDEQKKKSRLYESYGRTCDRSMEESFVSPSIEHAGEASRLQKIGAGLSGVEEGEQDALLSPASTSLKNGLSSPPQKNVRFASPLSPSSPSKKPCTHDSNVPVSYNPKTSAPKTSDAAVNSHRSPAKEHSRLEFSILNPSADPLEDVCMSGALYSNASKTVLSNLNSPQARRLQIVFAENDSTVCSDDLNLQVKHMPFRLVSQEELVTIWAESFFSNPNKAITAIPSQFFTTPLGIATAKTLSEYWIRQLIEENVQALKDHDPTLDDQDIAHKTLSFRRSPWFRLESDRRRLRALFWFGGEFDRRDYSCVKYPENLLNYVTAVEEYEEGLNYSLVWDFWEEFYGRGRVFWSEFGGESDMEDSELEMDTDESERKSQDDELLGESPGQNVEMSVSSTGVEEENGL